MQAKQGWQPIRVAIVGGGCAAVSTAFELTRPEHRGRYQVTLYQLGWRLGGKGASGRGPADRIEEHGFHVWMGFYENAFRLLRECYAELDRDPARCPISDWRDAFAPDPVVGVVDRDARGAPQDWLACFPTTPGLPGDPEPPPNLLSVAHYLKRTASLLRALLRSCQPPSRSAAPEPLDAAAAEGSLPSVEAVRDTLSRLFRYGLLASAAGLVEAVRLLEAMLSGIGRYPRALPLRLLDEIGVSARGQLAALAERDDEVRRVWEVVDIVLAVLRGALRFGLATDPRGLDGIDDYDWREWLELNGASKASLDSGFLRGIYALAFAYESGDVKQPRLSAAIALRGAFRMFLSYRGALFWKMQAGMGDVVFAPFYEVLKRRGVRFEFFHRLENLKLVDPAKLEPGEKPYVEALEFDVQARTRDGAEYQPLIEVRGLPCWPSQPDWAQLEDGERLRREGWDFESFWDARKRDTLTLRVVEDFDCVVLGVGLGAVPWVCRELVARDSRWRDMVEKVGTVSTQAFQLWLRDEPQALGWRGTTASVSGFIQPFETWADMPQLRHQESWPSAPGAIAYFLGVLPDPAASPQRADTAYPGKRRDEVRAAAVDFLEHHVGYFWPRAEWRPGRFRWELLLDPAGRRTPAPERADASRFDSQFWTANVNPSDRYVLSLPGSQRYRISPLDNHYDNLTLAGDWTECGHNAGCVEAAVMAGRLAAHAIAHSPPLEDIVGYDHP